MVHIYNDKLIFLLTLNYEYEDFIKNPKLYYPDWNEKYYATITLYNHPILDKDGKTIREKTKYELYKSGEYELSFNEVELNNDIITLNGGQYVKDNQIVTVPKIEGVRVEWNWELHIWEEKATNLEVVQHQYKEYEGMDTPSVIKEMNAQDPAIAEELLNMLIELRGLIYALSVSDGHRSGFSAIHIPKPSKALIEFKERFYRI